MFLLKLFGLILLGVVALFLIITWAFSKIISGKKH